MGAVTYHLDVVRKLLRNCKKILTRFTDCCLFIKTHFVDIPTWLVFVSILFCFEKEHDSPFFCFYILLFFYKTLKAHKGEWVRHKGKTQHIAPVINCLFNVEVYSLILFRVPWIYLSVYLKIYSNWTEITLCGFWGLF